MFSHGRHLRGQYARGQCRFTSLFEPLVIVTMGLIVGTLNSEHVAGDSRHE
jgi:type II secretory pathway component PulF